MPQHLVTGGAGCIGSELCEALLDRGHEVTAYDNLSSGKIEHLANLQGRPGFRFVEADMLDARQLDQALVGVEMVHHLAANPDVKFTAEEPDRDLQQNTVATARLLEAMRRQGVRKLTFSSTSAVYGINPRLPIAEDEPLRPISLYGATKAGCETLIAAYQHLFDMQCWVFRFANVVGHRTRKKGRTVISDFIAKLRRDPRRLEILGNGQQAKSYLLSAECVEAMLYVVDHARAPFNLFNLGGDDWLSVSRIAEMVVSQMGLSGVEFSFTGAEGGWPGDVPRFRLDVRRLNELGWRAKHTSEQAVAAAIRSILDAPPG